MYFLCNLLIGLCLATTVRATESQSARGPGRNLFQELLGKTESEVNAKLSAGWQQLFYGSDTEQRVYFPVGDDLAYIHDIASDDVRSEGMSYGLMIAVQLDHQAEFNRLWKWTKLHMYHSKGPRKGYFAWQCKVDGTQLDPGSASDGEEWFATALLFAANRWGSGQGIFNYGDEAQALLQVMRHKPAVEGITPIFDATTKQVVFVPNAEASRLTDPSYHLPAFYELWARWSADADDRKFWHEAAGASREFFHRAAHPRTGLMPEYAEFDGRPSAFLSEGKKNFSYDAWRTLANVGLDYSWFGADVWQVEQSNRVLRFLASGGPHYPNQYTLEGKPLSGSSSVGLVAMAAVAGLAADPAVARPFVQQLWDAPIPSGHWRYYDGMLYLLGLLEVSGRFQIHYPPVKLNLNNPVRVVGGGRPNPASTELLRTNQRRGSATPPYSRTVSSGWIRKTLLSRLLLLWLGLATGLQADDGYRLWLRYDRMADEKQRTEYAAALTEIVFSTPTGKESPTTAAARDELVDALTGLLGAKPAIGLASSHAEAGLGEEGYTLHTDSRDGHRVVTIAANHDIGILYGAFALLRLVQTGESVETLNLASVPKIKRRLLNHWDNLNGFIERGYAGASLWKWFTLPEVRDPRYRDYARACASLGLNGAVLTNVNANPLVLTPEYLTKVAALADEFRPYGVRVYLPARFSAPIETGDLKTADPLDSAVAAWWKTKIDEIYRYVPDFGGFLVKANSEGQPGPQDYHRTHADGANMMADALAPQGGIVLWRAFVYQAKGTEDRVKQAYNEFMPLDGKFRDNVVVQIKNGPLDFMPREPFHPLFGGMAHTPLALELQITQEYLGGSTQLAYLAPLYKETLEAETFANGAGSTVARVIDGSLHAQNLSVIAGVANTGSDRNWTGHPLAQANWYAYGRLAWDHSLSAETLAREWTQLTFGLDPATVRIITQILLGSRETVVNYSMPLGLHHIMAEGHHYGPGPWVHGSRPDWSSAYYHQADEFGLGANRGTSGTNALATYAPELAKGWGDPATCPEKYLLWFHHVAWDYRMKSGRTLWDELSLRYQQGVDEVRTMQHEWDALAASVDHERFVHVQTLLQRQEKDAREWRDACLLYFQQFSKRPLPAGVEPPEHDLAYYEAIKVRYVPGHPGDY